jgi:hypothetical protein
MPFWTKGDHAPAWRRAGASGRGRAQTFNERANIDRDELRALQEIAKDLLGLDDRQLDIALQAGEIVAVRDGNEEA